MKLIPRLLAAGCLFALPPALIFPSAPACAAASSDGSVDINFFYDTLKDQGSWFNTTEYGDVWQPYIAYKNESWHPYTDGYWTYTDGGWMFVSYESFGWAVYHYGRWTHLKDIGWSWVPGTEWAPAWVAWRTSDPDGSGTLPDTAHIAATSTDKDAGSPPPPASAEGTPGAGGGYVGWAPLPPEAVDNGNYAYGPTVDADFGIDPYDYCFTDVSAFGAPWIGGVIFDSGRSYDCCDRSYNVTRYSYDRAGAYRGVYAGGPNYDRLRGRTAQPLRQVAINRQTSRSAERISQVNDRSANVFAPRFSRRGVGSDGRVKFNRQGAVAKAEVLPAAQRGGGASAEAQGRAREAFARQAQDSRQHNSQAATSGQGGAGTATRGANPPGTTGGKGEHRQDARRQAQAGTESVKKSRRNAAGSDTGRHSHATDVQGGSVEHHGGGNGGGRHGGDGGGHSGGGHNGGGHGGGGGGGGGQGGGHGGGGGGSQGGGHGGGGGGGGHNGGGGGGNEKKH